MAVSNEKSHIVAEAEPTSAPVSLEVKGETNVYGKLLRVGGLKPRAMLMLESGKMIDVDVTEDLAVEMASGQRLYKMIGLEGEATWRADTGVMIGVRARVLLPYRRDEGDPVRAFELLAEAAEARWDNVYVVEYVNELRGRDQR